MPYISILLFIITLVGNQLQAQTLRSVWSNNIGGSSLDIVNNFTVTPNREIWTIGTTLGDIGTLVNAGGEDCFIFQLDSNGNIINEYIFGGVSLDGGKGITTDDNNNIWVSGYFRETLYLDSDSLVGLNGNDAFLIHIAPNGQILHKFSIRSNGFDTGEKVIYQDGFIYWSGTFQDTIIIHQDTLIEQGLGDAFLIKMDTTGNIVWSKQWGYLSGDLPIDLGIDSLGNLTIVTSFRDGIIVEGDTIIGNGANDILVHQYNNSGQLLWATAWGGSNDDLATSIEVTLQGNIYITGSFLGHTELGNTTYTSWGEEDIFVLALHPSGNIRWSKHIYGYDKLVGEDIAWSPQKAEIYVLGLLQGALYLSPNDSIVSSGVSKHVADDIALVALDTNGAILYGEAIGSTKEDYAVGIRVDKADDAVYITGNFLDTTDILGQVLYGAGMLDIFVAKLGFQLPSAVSSLPSIQNNPITLYPNPFVTHTTLEFVANQNSIYSFYTIHSIDGKLLDRQPIQITQGKNYIPINTQQLHLPPNIYTLTLYCDTQQYSILFQII